MVKINIYYIIYILYYIFFIIDGEHIYSDYTPTHLHHNWRYSNIYEEAAKYEKDPNYNPNN